MVQVNRSFLSKLLYASTERNAEETEYSAVSAVSYLLTRPFQGAIMQGLEFFQKARFRFALEQLFSTDVRQKRYQRQSEAFLEVCFHALPGLHRMTPEIDTALAVSQTRS